MSSSSNSQGSNSLMTIVIDMNRHEFVDHTFTHKELYVIESLHNFVEKQQIKKNKDYTFFSTMNSFFNQKLLKESCE